jgi:integrator complex subunit 3
VKVIGRDLVRLLHSSAALPEIESVFRTVLGATVTGPLPPDIDADLNLSSAASVSNLRLLLNTKTPRQFLESRLTPEMDNWLIWMMNNVKMGNQSRYQRWFASRFLGSPESENLLPELVRFVRL